MDGQGRMEKEGREGRGGKRGKKGRGKIVR